MKESIIKFVFLLTTLLLVSCSHAARIKQPLPHPEVRRTKLTDIVGSFEVKNESLIDYPQGNTPWYKGLSKGEILYAHPNNMKGNHPKFSISLASVTVKEILDALTEKDPIYYWEENHGVVNFIPNKPAPGEPDVVAVLNQIVPMFSVRDAEFRETWVELIEQARAQGLKHLYPYSSAVEKFKKERRMREKKKGHWRYWARFFPRFSLKLENKTLRECLNIITALDPPSKWFAYPYGEDVIVMLSHSHNHPDVKTQVFYDDEKKYYRILSEIGTLLEKRRTTGLSNREKKRYDKLQEEKDRLRRELKP